MKKYDNEIPTENNKDPVNEEKIRNKVPISAGSWAF